MGSDMIVLTINSGSTSVKLAAFDTGGNQATERIANEQHSSGQLEPPQILRAFMAKLRSRPAAVAHRVVHGGRRFTGPTRIDANVSAAIAQLSELAPLHNPKALEWIEAAREVCGPAVAHVAAFDTSFYVGLPRVAGEYALPPRMSVEHGVRRYGFHGLAHEAMWRRWCELNPRLAGGGRLITLQLGGGCSITAIDRGHPVDTSMGFSPLEGLVMATRSGDVDPAIVPYLQRRLSMTSDKVVELLNRESGLAGLSGGVTNLATLLADPSPLSQFAVDIYCYRASKYVGAYFAVLGGCDGIVFGGGVGEHVPAVRARILGRMRWAGIELDSAANEAAQGAEARIGTTQSSVALHVIPVDEELVLARAAVAAIGTA
jgi:acetate kinase